MNVDKDYAIVQRCRFVHYLSSTIIAIRMSQGPKKFLAVARQNGTIQIWNPRGNLFYHERTLASVNLETIEVVGSRVFGAGLDGDIHEFDLESSLVKKTVSSYGGAVWSMKANPSNEVLAVGCEDGSIRLFKITETGVEYMTMLEKQASKVLCLNWHPYKPIIVCGGTSGTIRAVHVDTGRTLKSMRVSFRDVVVWDILVLQDGTIVSGDSNGKVIFWNGRTGTMIKRLEAHDADVLCLTVDDTNSIVYSSGVDRKVCRIAKVVSKKDSEKQRQDWIVSTAKRYHTHDVRSMIYLPGRQLDCLVSGGVDTSLIFAGPTAEFARMKQQRLGQTPQHSPISYSSANRLIICHFDNSIRVWKLGNPSSTQSELHDGQRVPHDSYRHLITIKCNAETTLVSSNISKDGSMIAGSDSYKIRLYMISIRPESVEQIHEDIFDELPGALHLRFSPDGSQLIVAGTDSKIYIIDLQSFKVVGVNEFHAGAEPKYITALAVSPCGKWLVSGDSSRRMVSYNLEELNIHKTLMAFSHMHSSVNIDNEIVTITTITNEIYMIDIPTNSLTPWSRTNSLCLPKKFLSRKETICGSFMFKGKFWVWGNTFVHPIDLNQDLGEDEYWKLDHRFQSLMYFNGDKERNEMVLVERPVLQILSELPEAFQKKKYGG